MKELLEAVFHIRSVLGSSWTSELVAASEHVSTEPEDYPLLGVVSRERLVKT
jgi:hypothetical protein